MLKKGIILLLIAGYSFISCKGLVLESREQCPQRVYLEFDNSVKFEDSECVFICCPSPESYKGWKTYNTTVGEIRNRSFWIENRRGDELNFTGIVFMDSELRDDGNLSFFVSVYEEYPTLYRFKSFVKSTQSECTVNVILTKEFLGLRLLISNYYSQKQEETNVSYYVEVFCNSAGTNVMSGVPYYGHYSVIKENRTGSFSFRIPRQLDESLYIRIKVKDSVSDEILLHREFSLWSILLQYCNITWQEDSLPDVELDVDIVNLYFKFSISNKKFISYELRGS